MRFSLAIWRRLPVLAVIAALFALTCTAVLTTASNAALEDDTPATYNMQGASQNTTPKWSADIPGLTRTHNVLALQEAGPIPPTNNLPGNNSAFVYQATIVSNGLNIYAYVRNFGTTSRPMWRNVFFMNTDPNGHRVNLAMMTEPDPNDFLAVPRVAPGYRLAFGVRLGDTWYFTVHGVSGNGFDMPGMIAQIRQAVLGTAYHNFVIMGDFNRDPATLNGHLPAGTYIYRTGRATQQSGGELDYMVTNRNLVLYQGRLIGGGSSDHYPVDFGFIQLRAAGLISVGSYSNYGDQERILDVANNSRTNGTHIVTYDPNGGPNQLFTTHPSANGSYTIRSNSTGKCLDLNNGTKAKAGDYVNEWTCQGQSTQNWQFTNWSGDPGAVKIVNVTTGYCLDVLGNQTGNGRWVGIDPCTGAANQKWTLESIQ